ncbi:Hypothetical protein SMAX5B_012191 [Scophthalmus maximus]|uniref:Ig-like domain-containing protein n=1 Tax=Scophthalmus maximus TaxID=52904 RepID=A0A2U9AYQ8_SCOMX|nr:Hypothetical protein SMAX5B_012191 [Scophthalmus maximus]
MSATSALWRLCVSLLFSTSLSCYQCLDDLNLGLRLCWGHMLTEQGIRNVGACFRKLDRIFNNNERVIEAGRVGKGYDKQLKELLEAEILPMAEEFDKKENDETVYEERLQTAADNFIAAASKLPRVSGCFPPCGFQSAGAVFNCVTCHYDSCEFPLDCPVKEMNAKENKRIQMWCNVPFHLPVDMEVIWRFAEEVNTQQVDQFNEVTAGMDRLYSIPSTSLQHQGTYQCEIYSGRRSIVRLYFYLAGCGGPLRAAGDIRPVSAPRRALSPFASSSSPPPPPPPPPFATAPHGLYNCFAAAAIPLPWDSLSVIKNKAIKSS